METNQLIEKAKKQCAVFGMMAGHAENRGSFKDAKAWNDRRKHMIAVLADLELGKWGELYDILTDAYETARRAEHTGQ